MRLAGGFNTLMRHKVAFSIAAALGSAALAVGTHMIDNWEKDRSARNLEVRATARDVAQRATKALAAMQRVNEERTQMALGVFDALAEDQRREMTRRTNAVQGTWREQRQELEVELGTSFNPKLRLAVQFAEVRTAVDTLTRCVEDVFSASQGSRASPPVCPVEFQRTETSRARFLGTLQDAVRTLR